MVYGDIRDARSRERGRERVKYRREAIINVLYDYRLASGKCVAGSPILHPDPDPEILSSSGVRTGRSTTEEQQFEQARDQSSTASLRDPLKHYVLPLMRVRPISMYRPH
jgi:hypothetical protein